MRALAVVVLPIALALMTPMCTSAAIAHTRAAGYSSSTHSALIETQRKKSKPALVTMRVAAGYGTSTYGGYRTSAWVPVRVAVTNHTSEDMTGTLEIAEPTRQNFGPPLAYHGLYEMPVTLPGGSTKRVVLYIPGYDVVDDVEVRFRGPHGLTASSTDFPSSVDASNVTVGVLAGSPADAAWLQHVNTNVTLNVTRLSPATLDPVPAALSNFDVIVLTNVDSSRLDREQLDALTQYVRAGGTVVLVGGPDWQETLRPLPSSLLPGRLVGARTVPDLEGLAAIGPSAPPKARTTVSYLSGAQGTVLARQTEVPLVVREPLGTGSITYLSFDPAVSPIAGWHGAGAFFARLLTVSAPTAFGQADVAPGPGNGPFPSKFMMFGPGGGIAAELANIPSAALPSLLLFVALTILYILLLGPANYLVLRRLRRLELSWVSIPVLGLLCVGTTFGVAYHAKGSTVLLNTVGFVMLDGHTPSAESLYVGLFAPVRGDYHLSLSTPALASTVPEFDGGGPGGPTHTGVVRFREGSGTDVTFQSMNMWSSRGVALTTTASVPGRVTSDLRVDAHGRIVGTVHNGTRLTLLRPVVMAGRAVAHLPDLPAGSSAHVKVRPSVDVYNMNPGIGNLYGNPRFTPGYMGGPATGFFGFVSNGPCCYGGPQLPQEKNFQDRIRNAIASLPEAWTIPTMGEVMFLGWTDAQLTPLTVDGGTPNQRDLTLITTPLSVRLPDGPFQLHSGTLGAQLVDAVPSAGTYNNGCCGPYQNKLQVGTGGSLTFQFEIPRAHRVHFRHLTLWVNAGGAAGDGIGSVYDWRSGKWTHIDLTFGDASLHDPDRFVSKDGALLLKLAPTQYSNDVQILNPYTNLQLTGSGIAS